MTQFSIRDETESNPPNSGPDATADLDSADNAVGQRRTRAPTQLATRIVAFFRTLTMQDNDPFIIL
jgi:hypothetical protein